MTPPDGDAPINEIRATRTRIRDECGRSQERLLERLQKLQERHRHRLLPLPPGEPDPAEQAS